MEEIFSGDYSRDMWDKINNAESIDDIKDALYLICCRLQEFESMTKIELNKALSDGSG